MSKKNIWFTSDSHYNHYNIIKYCARPFKSCLEMNEAMITRWNEVVKPGDDVFHLGDFGMTQKAVVMSIIRRLNGTIFLIKGNHDKNIKGAIAEQFAWVKQYHEFTHNKTKFVLCHYPLKTWNGKFRGSYNLFGHAHGNIPSNEFERYLDVGVDTHDFYPYSIEEVHAIMAKKRWQDRINDKSY